MYVMATDVSSVEKRKIPSEVGNEAIVRPLDETVTPTEDRMTKRTIIIVYIALAVLGIGTGYFLSRGQAGSNPVITEEVRVEDGSTVVGSSDTETFKDSATGTLEKGGINGEGTHQLVREGGPSQTVYLISSIVDLDEFVGKEVTVWGQTMDAQKAGWLMDVGKIQFK